MNTELLHVTQIISSKWLNPLDFLAIPIKWKDQWLSMQHRIQLSWTDKFFITWPTSTPQWIAPPCRLWSWDIRRSYPQIKAPLKPCKLHTCHETIFKSLSHPRPGSPSFPLHVRTSPLYGPVTLQGVCPAVRGFTRQWNHLQRHHKSSEIWCFHHTTGGKSMVRCSVTQKLHYSVFFYNNLKYLVLTFVNRLFWFKWREKLASSPLHTHENQKS